MSKYMPEDRWPTFADVVKVSARNVGVNAALHHSRHSPTPVSREEVLAAMVLYLMEANESLMNELSVVMLRQPATFLVEDPNAGSRI